LYPCSNFSDWDQPLSCSACVTPQINKCEECDSDGKKLP
jgi:hypothetical protein